MVEDILTNNVNCNCSYFTNSDFKMIGMAQIGGGGLSLIGCIVMLSLIMILRRYKDSTQRLLLYLNIAVILNSIIFIVRGIGYKHMDDSILCKTVAYLGQITGWCVLSTIGCIICEIFIKAVLDRRIRRYEWVYLMLIFVMPPILNIIPFSDSKYGNAGPWCWIVGKKKKEVYDSNGCQGYPNESYTCEKDIMGVTFQYTLWFGPVYAITLIGGVVYLVSMVTIWRKLKWHKIMYSSHYQKLHQKQLLSEINHYRWYPIIYFTINIIPLATRISDALNVSHSVLIILWLLTATVEGSQGFFLALMFTLTPSTRKYLTCRALKRACKKQERKPLLQSRDIRLNQSGNYSNEQERQIYESTVS